MTKVTINRIIKRYSYLQPYIKRNEKVAVYYIGNRKFTTVLTYEIITICNIVEEIYVRVTDKWLKYMIGGIITNKSDVNIMMHSPWERNAYYKRKKEFYNCVYSCCIARGLVSYEEILADNVGIVI